MVQPTAQARRVMATYIKTVPDFMAGIAVSLYAEHSGLNLVAKTGIYRHGLLLWLWWLKMGFIAACHAGLDPASSCVRK
jgi:hypothetical protein